MGGQRIKGRRNNVRKAEVGAKVMEQQILPFELITDWKIDDMEFVRLFWNCKGPLMGNTADLKDIKSHGKSHGYYLHLVRPSNSKLAGVVNTVAHHSGSNLKATPSATGNYKPFEKQLLLCSSTGW